MKFSLLIYTSLLLLISANQLPLQSVYSFLSNDSDPLSPKTSTIDSWIQWKNSYTRFDSHFTEIPNKLAPETQEYQEGLVMQSWWAMLLVTLEIAGLCTYLTMNFKDSQGRESDEDVGKYSRDIRWTPGTLTLVSFVLFMTGGLSLLVANSTIREQTEKAVEITAESVMKTSEILVQMKYDLVNMNMRHITSSGNFLVDTGFLKEPLENSQSIHQRASKFEQKIDSFETKRSLLSYVILSLGCILYILGFSAFLFKLDQLAYGYGLSLAILLILSTLLLIPYYSLLIGSIDICQELRSCDINQRIPEEGYGLGYYYPDYNTTSRVFFIEGEYCLTHNIQLALENLNLRLKSLYLIPAVTDISSLATLQTSTQLDRVTQDWISTVKQLQIIRDKLGELIRSEHMLNYCKEELNVCRNLIGELRLGILGLVILNLSFLIGCIGGLLAPTVIKRWIKDEERNIILSGLSLTDV